MWDLVTLGRSLLALSERELADHWVYKHYRSLKSISVHACLQQLHHAEWRCKNERVSNESSRHRFVPGTGFVSGNIKKDFTISTGRPWYPHGNALSRRRYWTVFYVECGRGLREGESWREVEVVKGGGREKKREKVSDRKKRNREWRERERGKRGREKKRERTRLSLSIINENITWQATAHMGLVNEFKFKCATFK